MITSPLRRVGLVSALLCLVSHASTIALFDFVGESLGNSATPIPGLTVSAVQTGSKFNAFSSSSGWDSAAQISGADAFFSISTDHSTAGNAIYFMVTASEGYSFSLESFGFQARSTDQAPADIGFKIGSNFYDFSDSYSNNSVITQINAGSLGFSQLSSVLISIQAWNASGSSALQIDNIQLTGAVVPEPSVLWLVVLGGCFLLRRRR